MAGLESLRYIELLLVRLSLPRLPVHVIQHPDASGSLRHGQRKAVFHERELNPRYLLRNHQGRTVKMRHLEWLTGRESLGCVKTDSPYVEESRTT